VDPDPYQNFMDPQHWNKVLTNLKTTQKIRIQVIFFSLVNKKIVFFCVATGT
jgi:hypothetical protein